MDKAVPFIRKAAKDKKPQTLKSMKAMLIKWRKSCQNSLAGKDYK
jgi:hypothetical protein